ncbi:hypothetical protein [Streptomyces cylindrosporus]|uniref:Uncharacterized protein n=1 Tax=Streptomyces cylindrosporus TaxID=2927583 RepID=A0ABS9Y2J0_9ACTN|nr:hypothetical protein [Streptomyces cylindrosporus]MCI3271422.1 hypothetical protein [Streptomyces cylindrosporus]
MIDRLSLTRDQLAALLAHHADVLAAGFRADLSTAIPEDQEGIGRAAGLLDLHAQRLTADEETVAVAELLDSMMTCPVDQPAVEPADQPRLFHLQRDHDVSGVSGTGRVANGVLWPDGTVSLRWIGERPSTVHWDRLADAKHVHGHGGATRIVWAEEQLAALTEADRRFLTFALDQAAEEMSLGDGFTDADQSALDKLRRIANEQP